MPEDLYSDAPDGAPASTPPEEGGAKTCLLPKSAFPDAQPGDQLSVEVVRVHEQEIEVQPAGSGKGQKPESAPAPDEGGGPMRSMLED